MGRPTAIRHHPLNEAPCCFFPIVREKRKDVVETYDDLFMARLTEQEVALVCYRGGDEGAEVVEAPKE